jgi:FkbM family methyltransferase
MMSLLKRALCSTIRIAPRILRNVPAEAMSEAWLLRNQQPILSGRYEQDLHLRYLVALVEYRKESKSQLGQDLFALAANPGVASGYFVEFGATNGLDLSNTWLLETKLGWKGILAEPNPAWHAELSANRSCSVDTRCVYSQSGQTLRFAATQLKELGSLQQFVAEDHHAQRRKAHEDIGVQSITLADLMEVYDAPRHINYLSLDTEGSEWEILRVFDFDRYRFGAITVEHNFSVQREPIHGLLQAAGYRRVMTPISQWDDWYVPAS